MGKQITVRPTTKEYEAFENWQQAQGLSESAALCELVSRYFDGGYLRAPKYRISVIKKELDKILQEN
jgi:hypothetical protein